MLPQYSETNPNVVHSHSFNLIYINCCTLLQKISKMDLAMNCRNTIVSSAVKNLERKMDWIIMKGLILVFRHLIVMLARVCAVGTSRFTQSPESTTVMFVSKSLPRRAI